MEKNKKNMAQNLKLQQHEVNSLTDKMKQPVSLHEAFLLAEEVLPNIATLLQFKYVQLVGPLLNEVFHL